MQNLMHHMNGVIFDTLTEPITINSTEVQVVPGLFMPMASGGNTMKDGDPVGPAMDAVVEIRPETASASIGDTVEAGGQVFTIVDIAGDACGNIRLVLKR